MSPRKTKAQKEREAALSVFGRIGGLTNSPAKDAARRRNAKLAGAPARVCDGCGERVMKPVRGEHGGHRDARLDARCKATAWHWETPSERRAKGAA